MNKKLLAVAVAGVLAAPVAAFAQSSVTISGYLKGSFDSVKVSGGTAGLRTGNTSETRVTDHSSRMLFNVVEDLGGGLQAIGQVDFRFFLDATPRLQATTAAGTASTSPTAFPVAGGNNHIGLRSKQWGTIKLGRQDTHYGNAGDTIPAKSGHLAAWNSSVFDCVARPTVAASAGGSGSAQHCMANLSRTPNLIWYDSPRLGGMLELTVGYSTNPTRASGTNEVENDLGTAGRKGRAWTFNPKLDGPNWHLSWSHWNSKSDWSGAAPSIATFTQGSANATNDEKSDTIRGHYIWGGFRVGLAWNRSKSILPLTGAEAGNRSAWAIPVTYSTGPHTFYLTYTKANDSKTTTAGASGADTGAKLVALAYNYDLSKRTSMGITYARLTNDANAAYNLFYAGDNVFGGSNGGSLAGEDWRLWGIGMRHNF